MDENKMTELNKAIEGMWDSLTDEQKVAAKKCKSMDELAALAANAGVELPDEVLDAVAGGSADDEVSHITCAYHDCDHAGSC